MPLRLFVGKARVIARILVDEEEVETPIARHRETRPRALEAEISVRLALDALDPRKLLERVRRRHVVAREKEAEDLPPLRDEVRV